MSLSSFLLKSSGAVDSELDALFKSQPAKSIPITSTALSESEGRLKKRKLVEEKSDAQPKRRKSDSKKEAKKPKAKAKARTPSPPPEEDEDDDSDLEAAYLRFKEETGPAEDGSDDAEEEVEDEGEDEASNLVHESLTGKAKSKSRTKTKKQKYTPVDETPAQRDQRTIFIGNLSLEVAQKRPLQKQLQRHILSFVPSAKIESIRFRSVPFSSPSANQSTTTEEDYAHKNPSQREHDRTRASSWRTSASTSTETETKSYLNPNQKKKYLFLTNQFHTSGATVHAYIVFAHPIPTSTTPRPSNLPPLPDVLDPYEAAKQAVKNADGTEFEGRLIRVDFVGKVSAKGKAKEDGEDGAAEETMDVNKAFEDADTKCTLFVGNLDLGAQEGDLRTFFDTLMKTERGEPSTEIEGASKPKSWVTHVRIIRDKDTQLGKGFGYVQFIDRECIDEILTLEPTQLKFAKRKLRVQRCKTLPGGTTKLSSSLKSSLKSPSTAHPNTSITTTANPKTKPTRTPPTPIQIPKGDPNLGAKLSAMSKDERKAAKAADADRVARRLAKKKARMGMGTARDRAGEGAGGEKKKVRERVRKSVGLERGGKGKGGAKGAKDGKKKSRVRSERSLEKRNAKK